MTAIIPPPTTITFPRTYQTIQTTPRGRVKSQIMLLVNPNGLTSTITWSPPTPCDQYKEALVIAALEAAQTGTAATFTLYLQTLDPAVLNTQVAFTNAGILLPSQSVAVASPGNSIGPLAVLNTSIFGSLVRVGVSAGTAWSTSSASGLSVTLQLKG